LPLTKLTDRWPCALHRSYNFTCSSSMRVSGCHPTCSFRRRNCLGGHHSSNQHLYNLHHFLAQYSHPQTDPVSLFTPKARPRLSLRIVGKRLDRLRESAWKFLLQGAVLTSMINRGRVFLKGLDANSGSIQSIAIDITKKLTESMFKEHGGKNTPSNRPRHTQHNSLLDCHAEVWSRYPVVAAVKRRTVTSSTERRQKSITLIADNHSHLSTLTFPISFRHSRGRRGNQRVTNSVVLECPRRFHALLGSRNHGLGLEYVALPRWRVAR